MYVRHHESCHYAQRSVQLNVPTASTQSGKHFQYGIFSKYALFKSNGVKKPTSLVRAYRDIIWCRWSDISPQIAKTEPFLVLSKSNGRLQATWHSGSELLVFQPYSLYRAFVFVVFRILSVTCSLMRALSQSLTHAQQLFSVSTPGQIISAEGLHFSAFHYTLYVFST